MLVWVAMVFGAFVILSWVVYRLARWLTGDEVDPRRDERDDLLEAEALTRSKNPFI